MTVRALAQQLKKVTAGGFRKDVEEICHGKTLPGTFAEYHVDLSLTLSNRKQAASWPSGSADFVAAAGGG